MANERKNLQHSAGRIQIADPPVILSQTGTFTAARVGGPGSGTVLITLVEDGLNPGAGIDPTERIVTVSSDTIDVIASTDTGIPADTDTSFQVEMRNGLGLVVDGIFSFEVERVDTPIGVT